MRNSKVKPKKNPAPPDEPLSQKEFKALIKEAGKGPFTSLENFVEDVKLQWKKKHKAVAKKSQIKPKDTFTKEEFIALIKEGERGHFTPLGSFEEFRSDILNVWKKKQGK